MLMPPGREALAESRKRQNLPRKRPVISTAESVRIARLLADAGPASNTDILDIFDHFSPY
jgi:hypothetical protein